MGFRPTPPSLPPRSTAHKPPSKDPRHTHKLFDPVDCARQVLSWKAYKKASKAKGTADPLPKQEFGPGPCPRLHPRLRFVQFGFIVVL